jgi:hypothetical protein
MTKVEYQRRDDHAMGLKLLFASIAATLVLPSVAVTLAFWAFFQDQRQLFFRPYSEPSWCRTLLFFLVGAVS